MNLTDKAIARLEQQPLHFIDILEPLRRETAQVLYAGGDGIQIQIHATIMQSSVSPQAAERLLNRLPRIPELFVAHESYEKEVFEHLCGGADAFEAGFCNPCLAAAYLKKEPLPVSERFTIRKLTQKYAQDINKQYHLFDDLPYIQERIQAGVFYGAFLNGELAGFICEHIEGTMGMLEVYPKFQRMGVASALEADAVNRNLAAGRTAFCDIILGNDASFALQKSLGLSLSDRPHYWLSGGTPTKEN